MAEAATQAPPLVQVGITVNGKAHQAEVEPRLLLVHFLRDVLGYTGTHVGCDTSQCGACVLLMNGEAVKSCTVLAVQADGAEITTVEGLAQNGQYHPVQQGFWEMHGLQCGFCTPGMIMSSVALLNRNPNPSEEEIRHALEGNLCRCTGYQNIVKAVQFAAGEIAKSQGATSPPLPESQHGEQLTGHETPPRAPQSEKEWGAELAGESDDKAK